MMIYYISDPTLTTNNVTEVVELVKDWDPLSWYLIVPANRLREIQQRCSTEREIANECASYYVQYHPKPSWTHLASCLYSKGEFAAVAKLKPFLPLRGILCWYESYTSTCVVILCYDSQSLIIIVCGKLIPILSLCSLVIFI